jgi:uncharacterized protein
VSELRINISKLPEGAHQRSLQAAPGEIGLDSRFTKEVSVEAMLEKTSRQLYVRVKFSACGRFTCDRCLEEYDRDISSNFGIMYVTDGESVAGGDDEVQVISADTNIVDIGEDVRQFAILALPQKNLCREDCAGLCPTCGKNLNRGRCDCPDDSGDPRWSALQKLVKN